VFEKNHKSMVSIDILEFLGAFLAAAIVFGTYYDAINRFDGGIRQVRRILELYVE
jgi:glycerol uptake facilitator-like aquaporin